MLTKVRGAVAAAMMVGALLVPVAVATDAAAATCARHTTGVCKANSPHPRGATAKCKDDSYSYGVVAYEQAMRDYAYHALRMSVFVGQKVIGHLPLPE
ncbi:hypothetical protein ACFY5F_45830 [Streptomyces sp. NPDC013161]|uniref:hypothetical protein n=1 Tax=Streptomyces sp. NPDC013161 TaxID=3364862 RepID=UPI0036A10748